jgi:tRNA A37 threonylcarbamoyladenosine dehydratase
MLIGEDGVEKLKNSAVMIFGIGGVGSFTVEALARAGMGRLILVDHDTISLTNLNRQIHANQKTVGLNKVEIMKERILSINPACHVESKLEFLTKDNIDAMIPKDIDYIVDAIDTVAAKIALAVWCEKNQIKLISSMGTGNKFDPLRFKITDIYKTSVCPLAKVMRHELKKREVKSLKVIFSDELPVKPLLEEIPPEGSSRRQIPGSISFVPSVAGLALAGQVIRDLLGMEE